jgi:hypothetical protein
LGFYCISGLGREIRRISRISQDKIYISVGTDSALVLTNELNLRILAGKIAKEDESFLVPITRRSSSWIFDAEKLFGNDTRFPASHAFLVNPELIDAVKKIPLIDFALKQSPSDFNTVERIASEGYIYVGWVMRDIDEAKLVREFLANRRFEDLDDPAASKEFQTQKLWRLRFEFESPDLDSQRHLIPLLVERYNPRSQFPRDAVHVAYLDGHIEKIQLDSKFPATREFYELFDL